MSQYDLSRPVLARLRDVADIVTVVGEILTLKKQGRNYVGLCPFHGEKAPSFSVSREKGTYYCFGCKRGGDVIDFVMETERLTFPEAAEHLAHRFGVELPPASPESRRRRDEQDALMDVMEAAQAVFVRRLGDELPRTFLERRGISGEFAATIGLGYAPAGWRNLFDALHQRFPQRTLVEAGLAVEGDQGRVWDRFRDRITIPIRSHQGRLIAFGGRSVGDDPPKYLNSPETPLFSKSRVLFAMDRANRTFAQTGRALVVEGYFDCLALHQAGLTDAVATMGTSLSEHHGRELARRVKEVVLCFDGDAAGRAAAAAALRTLLAFDLEASVLLLPDNQDPDDVVRLGGKEAFMELLGSALDVTQFLLGELGATRDLRRRNAGQAVSILGACADPVRRFLLKESLAYAAGLSLAELGEAQTLHVRRDQGSSVALPPPGEMAILRALLFDLPEDERGSFLASLPMEAIDHPATLSILSCLKERAAKHDALEIFAATSDIEDREVRRVLAAIEHEAPPTTAVHREMRELWGKHRQRRLAALNREIAQAEKQGNKELLTQLLRQKNLMLKKAETP